MHESGEPKALRPIDPQHDLMSPVAAAARAFEFHDDWTLADRRHAVRAGGGQADEHRAGGGADGRHAGQDDLGAGAVPHAQRPAAAGGRSARGGRVRHAAAADQRPAGDAGKGRAERVLRAAGRPPMPTRRSCWSFATRCPATAAGSICRRFPRSRPWSRRTCASICPRRGRCWACAGRGPRSSAGGCDPSTAMAAVADGRSPISSLHWVREGVTVAASRRRRLPDRRAALRLLDAPPGRRARRLAADDHDRRPLAQRAGVRRHGAAGAAAAAGPAARPRAWSSARRSIALGAGGRLPADLLDADSQRRAGLAPSSSWR